MGIYDRDYLKRPTPDSADDDGIEPPEYDPSADFVSSSSSKLAYTLSRFFQRHPRFFIYVGVALVALIVAALVTAAMNAK